MRTRVASEYRDLSTRVAVQKILRAGNGGISQDAECIPAR
jgi:hypothetical protein